MKKLITLFAAAIMVMAMLSGCGDKSMETAKNSGANTSASVTYKDGTYSAESAKDQYGNYSTISITVKDGKIASVDWKELTKDGKPKDDTYGKTSGKDEDYKAAQNALKNSKTYGDTLVKVQDVDKVDAVSGATQSNRNFKELAKKALETAKK